MDATAMPASPEPPRDGGALASPPAPSPRDTPPDAPSGPPAARGHAPDAGALSPRSASEPPSRRGSEFSPRSARLSNRSNLAPPPAPAFLKLPSTDTLVAPTTPELEMRRREFLPLIHHEDGGSRVNSSLDEHDADRDSRSPGGRLHSDGGAPRPDTIEMTRRLSALSLSGLQQASSDPCWCCECGSAASCARLSSAWSPSSASSPAAAAAAAAAAALPCSVRWASCVRSCLLWWAGAYAPGGDFKRSRLDAWAPRLLGTVPDARGTDEATGVAYEDFEVRSTRVFGNVIPVRVYSPPPERARAAGAAAATATATAARPGKSLSTARRSSLSSARMSSKAESRSWGSSFRLAATRSEPDVVKAGARAARRASAPKPTQADALPPKTSFAGSGEGLPSPSGSGSVVLEGVEVVVEQDGSEDEDEDDEAVLADGPPHGRRALWPVVLYFHGGGFCVDDHRSRSVHEQCVRIAAELRCVVVSVSHALAPERPFPEPVLDAYDVLRWVSDPAKSFGKLPLRADRQRVVLWGESTGGGLALTLATLARDGLTADLRRGGPTPPIAHVVLAYPCLYMIALGLPANPFDASAGGGRLTAEETRLLPLPVRRFFVDAYVPGGPGRLDVLSRTDRRMCALLAGAEDLPPVTVLSAGADSLRHENAYAVEVMRSANVRVTHHTYEGAPHAFLAFPELAQARAALRDVAGDLKHVLAHDDFGGPAPGVMGVAVVVPGIGDGVVTGFRERDRMFRVKLSWGAWAYVKEGTALYTGSTRLDPGLARYSCSPDVGNVERAL